MNGIHLQIILGAAMLLAIHVLDVNREVLLKTTASSYPSCGMVTVAMGTNATAKTRSLIGRAAGESEVSSSGRSIAVLNEKSGATARSVFSKKSGNTAAAIQQPTFALRNEISDATSKSVISEKSGNTARTRGDTDLFAARMRPNDAAVGFEASAPHYTIAHAGALPYELLNRQSY